MKLNSFNNGFLRSAATDAPEGGGGAAQQTKPEEQAAPPAKKPGVVQMALAGLQDKATLNNRIKELELQLAGVTAENATLKSENGRLTQEVADYAADMATLEAALNGERQETKSVATKAAQIVKEKGFDSAALPEPAQEATDTREGLEKAIAKETDPKKKWDLCERLAAIDD